MTFKQDLEDLCRVKLALADKYENLATSRSTVVRGRPATCGHVAKFRRQAADLRNLMKK